MTKVTVMEGIQEKLSFECPNGLSPNDAYYALIGAQSGFGFGVNKIVDHLKSLPLESMTGKEVEESLFNEFLHIQ